MNEFEKLLIAILAAQKNWTRWNYQNDMQKIKELERMLDVELKQKLEQEKDTTPDTFLGDDNEN